MSHARAAHGYAEKAEDRMAYDPSLDVKLAEAEPIKGENDSKILIGIFSYNHGPRKVRINRASKRSNGEIVVGKLGGLTPDEALAVATALVKIANAPEARGTAA